MSDSSIVRRAPGIQIGLDPPARLIVRLVMEPAEVCHLDQELRQYSSRLISTYRKPRSSHSRRQGEPNLPSAGPPKSANDAKSIRLSARGDFYWFSNIERNHHGHAVNIPHARGGLAGSGESVRVSQ